MNLSIRKMSLLYFWIEQITLIEPDDERDMLVYVFIMFRSS